MLVETDAPQGSILCPLLFVNFYERSIQSFLTINCAQNRLVINMKKPNKTCSMVFCTKHNLSHSFKLIINFHEQAALKLCNVFKYLRPWLDPELTLKPHIDYICKIIFGLLSSLY